MSVYAADSSKNGAPAPADKTEEKGKPEDESIIVNKDGLNEAEENDVNFEKNKIKPPKGLDPMTLDDVASKAKENHLKAVSALMIWADESELNKVPVSAFQIAEKKLEEATKTDEQQVNFGPSIGGADDKEGDEESEDDNKEDEEAQGGEDKEPSTNEGNDSSGLKAKAK